MRRRVCVLNVKRLEELFVFLTDKKTRWLKKSSKKDFAAIYCFLY